MALFYRSRIVSHQLNPLLTTCQAPLQRSFASRRAAALAEDNHEDDLTAARGWLATLNAHTIPRNLFDISFSRSGGPGGQNVNKVNSKATLKISLDDLLPHVPRLIHPPLQTSRYIARRTNSLVIQSEESRKQVDNVDACFDKLYQLLRSSATEVIPGETSLERLERAKKLSKEGTETRLKNKKMHSSKKTSRRSTGGDE